MCEVSYKSNKRFRRSCACKVHGRTDRQGDSYIPPQTLFAGGITRWQNYIKYMLQRIMIKCNGHRLKYLVLYYKRVIALILRNIVPRSISYCTCKLMQYDILIWTIFLNSSAITLQYKFGYISQDLQISVCIYLDVLYEVHFIILLPQHQTQQDWPSFVRLWLLTLMFLKLFLKAFLG